jgi:hypothetical protein
LVTAFRIFAAHAPLPQWGAIALGIIAAHGILVGAARAPRRVW